MAGRIYETGVPMMSSDKPFLLLVQCECPVHTQQWKETIITPYLSKNGEGSTPLGGPFRRSWSWPMSKSGTDSDWSVCIIPYLFLGKPDLRANHIMVQP